MSGTELVPVSQLQEGDLIDLEGDPLVDPDCSRVEFEFEFATVHEIDIEGAGAVAVYWDNGGYCFPAEHKVKRQRA